MRSTTRLATFGLMLMLVSPLVLTHASPLAEQTPAREGLMGDLLKDVNEVQTKVVGLAKAMPAASYDWRPGKAVRSTGETLMHIAADNYLLPAMMGITPPAETGINGKEYKTAVAFEKRPLTRDQIIAELEKSFAFLKTSMASYPDAKLDAPLDVFGQKSTGRGMWITTATHLHEHLGQLIAYARSNNVTPPWSK
jgi:DinB superfamily